MTKISIGLRGWRFDEDVVFTADGDVRDITEMPADTRNRLLRLGALLDEPCAACWLVHGEEHVQRCNPAEIVYGEPLAEVVLCPDHERDFLYWFRERGGREHAGSASLRDEFHAWFADGNRAPADYEAIEHVDTAADSLPDPTHDNTEPLDEVAEQATALDEAERAALDVDLGDLDP